MKTNLSKTGLILQTVIRDCFPLQDSDFEVYLDDPGDNWNGDLNYCVISLKAYHRIDFDMISDFMENLLNHGYICYNFYFKPMIILSDESSAPYLQIAFNVSTDLV